MNLTCNSTLEHMRISPGSEILILGPLNFHELARIIAASCTLIATVLSLYLIVMHSLNYTQPRQQRYIIRILFMVPVYAISSFLQLQWYWHAIYFQVLADCYEAFAIASFFALLCHYVAPDLHLQKAFFREMRPVKPWVLPVNWMAKCCGGEKGIWRTPKSGLTWFNIIWIGIYQYCFIRVAMTITAVVTQYFNRYCESSNLPVFGHIWIIIINALSVTVAMFCVIQFYVQLTKPLSEHKLFVKIIAIKLVVFLSFWQASAISVGTSTLKIVHPNKVIAYPDLKVGIPALLLCVEMAAFSILHLWAFPYAPYVDGAPSIYYPTPDPKKATLAIENERQSPAGGFLGVWALWDAMNLWDFVKAFGRGMRWLVCGVKRRKEDISYKLSHHHDEGHDLENLHEAKPGSTPYNPLQLRHVGSLNDLSSTAYHGSGGIMAGGEERAGLMYNAQPNPEARALVSSPQTSNYPNQQHAQLHTVPQPYDPPPYSVLGQAFTGSYGAPPPRPPRPDERTDTQVRIGEALWGPGPERSV